MQTLIFTVYDEKAEAYLPPFYLTTIAQAERAITDCVNDPKHQFCAHPADYTLFIIGTFDNQNAEIKYNKSSIANLLEYKKQSLPLPLFEQINQTDADLEEAKK